MMFENGYVWLNYYFDYSDLRILMSKASHSHLYHASLYHTSLQYTCVYQYPASLQVRQGLKTYSNWPTYPQLYVNGELVGGLDIVKVSMHGSKVNIFHV